MRQTIRRVVLIFTILTVAGCGSSNSSSPTSPAPNAPASAFTATIDGVQWSSVATVALKTGALPGLPQGTVSVSGTNLVAIPVTQLAFAVPAVVGTYALGPVPLGTPLNVSNASVQINGNTAATSASWTADGFNGSGSITLATLTATGASGIFSFTAAPVKNTAASGTKVVTNGSFNVKF